MVTGGRSNTPNTVEIRNSTIADNTVSGRFPNIGSISAGGGVDNSDSPLTLIDTTVSGNVVLEGFHLTVVGGGISNDDQSPLMLVNTSVSSNRSDGDGGGIANEDSAITLIHSTITGNIAREEGGGLHSDFGTVTLRRTLIAGNAAAGAPEIAIRASPVNVGSHNLLRPQRAIGGHRLQPRRDGHRARRRLGRDPP